MRHLVIPQLLLAIDYVTFSGHESHEQGKQENTRSRELSLGIFRYLPASAGMFSYLQIYAGIFRYLLASLLAMSKRF